MPKVTPRRGMNENLPKIRVLFSHEKSTFVRLIEDVYFKGSGDGRNDVENLSVAVLKMDEDGFDPCECIWGHNMAMYRLLSFLRQSQAYCTDTECFNELPGDLSTDNSLFFIAIFWIFFTVILYFLRPSTFRRRREDVLKSRNNENDSSGNSPAPPPVC